MPRRFFENVATIKDARNVCACINVEFDIPNSGGVQNIFPRTTDTIKNYSTTKSYGVDHEKSTVCLAVLVIHKK